MNPKVGGCLIDPPHGNYKSFNRIKIAHGGSTSKDVDLRSYSSPRHDQRKTSSCVAQSVVKALELKRIMKHGHAKHVDLSIADLYYGARDMMSPKMTDQDSGTFISLACHVLQTLGVCRDVMHPFNETNLYRPPSVMATREARLNRIKGHFRILSQGNDRIDDMVYNLHAGNPVVFGTLVGTDWYNYKGKGVIGKESDPKGMHAMVIVGYVDGKMIVENSWGTDFGENGFAYVDPAVFSDLSRTKDCWVIVDGSEAWYEEGVTNV